MKKNFFYYFVVLSIFFSENKPSFLQNFLLIEDNFALIKKLYKFSKNTHQFFQEYYAARDKNIKKILCCSAVLTVLNNCSIKSLRDIFKKESIKQSLCSSTIRFTGCSIIHFTEGLFSYITLKNMKKLPIYRDRRGISTVLHEFNINDNEIIKLKEEIQSLETTKEKEINNLVTQYKIALENEQKNFAQAQAQLKNQLDKKQENKIIEIKSLSEQKINILTQEYQKRIIALEKEKVLNEKKQDELTKTIEQKEKDLFILELEVKQKNQSVKGLKEQFKKLQNCWTEAKEKNNKEAKAASLPKIDLIPVKNDSLLSSDMFSLHRLEQVREQFGVPPASL